MLPGVKGEAPKDVYGNGCWGQPQPNALRQKAAKRADGAYGIRGSGGLTGSRGSGPALGSADPDFSFSASLPFFAHGAQHPVAANSAPATARANAVLAIRPNIVSPSWNPSGDAAAFDKSAIVFTEP